MCCDNEQLCCVCILLRCSLFAYLWHNTTLSETSMAHLHSIVTPCSLAAGPAAPCAATDDETILLQCHSPTIHSSRSTIPSFSSYLFSPIAHPLGTQLHINMDDGSSVTHSRSQSAPGVRKNREANLNSL